jgi:hypothetical protein
MLRRLLALLFGFALLTPATYAQERTITSEQFLDGLGMNVHLMYTDGGYAHLDKVFAALQYVGITHVRDALRELNWEVESRFQDAAENGLQFDLFVDGNVGLSDTMDRLRKFAERYPGHLAVIEGPNEINNWPVKYHGLSGMEAAAALQNDLYDAVRADEVLSKVPIYNYTGFPDPGGKADFTNIHPYPKGGSQPRSELDRDLETYSRLVPGKPVVITEVGYPTLRVPSSWGGVGGDTQAKLTLNLLFDAALLGIGRTYVYQLLDAYPDKTGTDVDKHLGLFDLQYHPKPVALAIHNLTTVLRAQPSANKSGASVGPVLLEGLPPTARSLSIKAADGSLFIAVWNEPQIWDADKFQPLPNTAVPVDIRFGAAADVAEIDLLSSEMPKETWSATRSVRFLLGDRPLLFAVH